jgi:hypothetical protein
VITCLSWALVLNPIVVVTILLVWMFEPRRWHSCTYTPHCHNDGSWRSGASNRVPWPRHSSSGYSLASHRGCPCSNPVLVKWDLWWTKWRWCRFSPSTSVSPANLYSTKFSIIIITRDRYNRPFSGRRAEWTQLGLHPPLCGCKRLPGLRLGTTRSFT